MAEHEKFFDNIGTVFDVQTAAFRFAVVSKALGYNEEDIPVIPVMYRNKLLKAGMTSQIERIVFLFAAGVITDEELHELFLIVKGKDISGQLKDAEDFLKADNNRTERERMPSEIFRKVLKCAAVSVKYTNDYERVSFDDARNIVALDYAKIVDGFVKVSDKELFRLLAESGEHFGYPKEAPKPDSNIENMFGHEDVQNGVVESENYPYMLNPKRLKYYGEVFGKPYGADFIKYAFAHDIRPDEHYLEKFSDYRRDIKCKFTIDSHERKRYICGDKINQFDYFLNVESERLNVDRRETITLNDAVVRSDDEMMRLALAEFCGKFPTQNETVLEVLHDRKKALYVVKDNDFIPLDPETFRSRLFDFDDVWGKIISYTTKTPLRVVNGVLEIPVDLIRSFDEKDRPYVENIITEQYSSQISHSRGNRVISKLSELEEDAAEKSGEAQKRREQQEKLKEERRKQFEAEKAKRASSTEG